MVPLSRNCSGCGKTLTYRRVGDYNVAIRNESRCHSCSQPTKISTPAAGLIRKCPGCKETIVHRNRVDYLEAVKSRRTCRQCFFLRMRKYPKVRAKDLRRKCPDCNRVLVYKNPFARDRAELSRSMCKNCQAIRHRLVMKGKKHSPESIEKMRQSQRKVDRSGAKSHFYGRNQSGIHNPMYGRKDTPETLAKKSAAQKGKPKTPETRNRIGEANRRKAKDPEFIRKVLKGLCAKPNKPETQLQVILDTMFPGEYKFTGDGSVVIGGMAPDFTNVNGQKKVIEMFGEYFHDPDKAWIKVRNTSTEDGRKKALKEYGFEALIVWSNELNNPEELTDKLKEFHYA